MTTIIKPNQNLRHTNWPLIFTITGLFVAIGNGIFLYNKIVNLQHLRVTEMKSFETEKLANVDLKNKLYQLTDSKNLINLANQSGMIKINNPEFLVLEQQVATR